MAGVHQHAASSTQVQLHKQIGGDSAANVEEIFLCVDKRMTRNNTCTRACTTLQQRTRRRT